MKNILVIFWGKNSTGGKIAYQFCKALSKKNKVFLSISNQSEYYDETKKLILKNYNINTYNGIFSFIYKTIFFYKIKKNLIKFIIENNINSVIFPMFHLWNYKICLDLKKLDITIILSVHDAKLHYGEFSFFSSYSLKKNINLSDHYIVFSNNVKNHVKSISKDSKKIFKINLPLFHNVNNAHLKYKKIEKNKLKILFYGRILKYKGLELLLKSIISIQKEYNIELSIVGSGNINSLSNYLKKINNLILINNWISDDDTNHFFSITNLCVLPYIEASQSGVPQIAFSHGIPVLATNIEGLSEQVNNMYNGILFEKNEDSLINAIKLLYNNNDLYEKLSINALKTINNEYNFLDFEKNLNNIIDKL